MNKVYSEYTTYSSETPRIDYILYRIQVLISQGSSKAVIVQNWIDDMKSCPGFIEFIIEDVGKVDNLRKWSLAAVFETAENTIYAKLLG